MTVSDSELRQEVSNSETPMIDDSGGDSDSGGSTFDFGISRRTMAVLGVVALVAVILLYLRRSNGGDGTESPDDGDDPDPSAAATIEIPQNPSEELDKDAAVLEGLRESGAMGGD